MRVANAGASAAHEVTLEFDPKFESSLDPGLRDGPCGKPLSEFFLFTRGLDFLAPGEPFTTSIDNLRHRVDANPLLPVEYQLRVKYTNVSGKQFYEDRRIDLELTNETMLPPETELSLLIKAVANLRASK
jgi:hypothetical protein